MENNDLFAGKMKCKRCRAYVPDDSDVCPMCGEDLTFLRELLKSVYEEDPKPGEPQPSPASSKEPFKEVMEESPGKTGEPRVILNSDPIDLGADYRVTFSMTDGLGVDDPASDSPQSPPWDHVLRGGFWRRLFAFEVDLLLLVLLLAIFVVAGFIAAEWGAGEGGVSLLKQARVIVPLILSPGRRSRDRLFQLFPCGLGANHRQNDLSGPRAPDQRPAAHLSSGAAANFCLSHFGHSRFSRLHLDGIHFRQTRLARPAFRDHRGEGTINTDGSKKSICALRNFVVAATVVRLTPQFLRA